MIERTRFSPTAFARQKSCDPRCHKRVCKNSLRWIIWQEQEALLCSRTRSNAITTDTRSRLRLHASHIYTQSRAQVSPHWQTSLSAKRRYSLCFGSFSRLAKKEHFRKHAISCLYLYIRPTCCTCVFDAILKVQRSPYCEPLGEPRYEMLNAAF